MAEQTVKVGMLGMGTVGGGVAEVLQKNGELIKEKSGFNLQLQKVLVRDLSLLRRVELPEELFTTDAGAVLGDRSIDLVIELIGGIEPARSYILEALQSGKHVITANKDLIARHGAELMETARHSRRRIFFEASVGGGIPLLRPLQHCLVANRIGRMIGIINGTTNYILTRMAMENMEFADALEAAQELGFAEADPSNDLEGRDAAYKLAILAGIAFGSRIDIGSIYTEGIRAVTKDDIGYARELGYTIKLLAVGEELADGLALRVHPALVPLAHPLAAVFNEFNAIFLEGNAVGDVMFYGRGAGALPTASAVIADIIDAARCLRRESSFDGGEIFSRVKPVIPSSSLTSCFYLRLQAIDRPGVFAALATAFGEEQVSLDMIIQKRSDGGVAEIVLVTHHVREERFERSLRRVKEFEAIKKINSVFRVLG